MPNPLLSVRCPCCATSDQYQFFKPTEGNDIFNITCHHCGTELQGRESFGQFIPQAKASNGEVLEILAVMIDRRGETEVKIQPSNQHTYATNVCSWVNTSRLTF